MEVKGLKTVVVGMQKSGIAAVEFLSRRGAEVRATDLKPLEQLPQAREVLDRLGVRFVQQSPAVFEGCQLAVISPDVPADLPILRGLRVIGEVELAGPYLKGQTIGITGSNGKTTTTSLIGHILRESGVPVQVGGNIGVAVTAMIDTSREDGGNALELSSFQLETIDELHADIALALNVTQNHLDRHHTFENYAAAKARLFESQRAGDLAILNAEDPVCVSYAERTKATVQWFSSRRKVEPGATLCGEKLVVNG